MPPETLDQARRYKAEPDSISSRSALHLPWMQLWETESELAEFPWDIGAEAPK